MSAVCCKRVWSSPYRSRECGNPAKFEVNGNHFCGIHNPNKAQTKAQIEAEETRKIQAKKYSLERAAPELLEALIAMVEMMDSGDESGAGSEWHTKTRAAIAKATGEGA